MDILTMSQWSFSLGDEFNFQSSAQPGDVSRLFGGENDEI